MPLIARRRLVLLCWLLFISLALPTRPAAAATQVDLVGPPLSQSFGQTVTALPNGNFVVTDSFYNSGAGAVYLYDGVTHTIISMLTGSASTHSVGSSGVTVLANGNFVVRSSNWDNGAITNAGAVTWGSATTGVDGTVSGANSLIGSNADEFLGGVSITVLPNGNYVVQSANWDNGSAIQAGAVTWGDGTKGVTGTISSANSLVGSTTNEGVGTVMALRNGHYVVRTIGWDNGPATNVGAITWGDGTKGLTGTISSANSLIGSTASDNVGSAGVIALANGHYVVRSTFWDNGPATNAGAVTWGDGTMGITGTVSSANSLVGSSASDTVGSLSIVALANGNYVVSSPNWDSSTVMNVGAATWGNGTTGITGTVSSANSLIGDVINNAVGSGGVLALSNGHYVVRSPDWDNGPATSAGAATWGDGTTGITGTVSSANSLVGVAASNGVGAAVIELSNSNYIVLSPQWDLATVLNVGAVTWGAGTRGVTGTVSSANSLVGSTASDQVGGSVTPLTNGHYVVRSPEWDNSGTPDAGAATWGNGTTGITGTVSSANSLVGSTANDFVGITGIIPLANGNYVVASDGWDAGTVTNAGAATWGHGTTGITGTVSSANSLIGSTTGDQIGNAGVTALSNGHYVVRSINWDNGPAPDAGAVTWGNGTTGITGTVSSANSLVGSTAYDLIGSAGLIALTNGHYVVRSSAWDNGALDSAGAVTWGDGTGGTTGPITSTNSVLGTVAGAGSTMIFAYDYVNRQLLVGRHASNIVTYWGPLPEITLPSISIAGGSVLEGNAEGGTASLIFTATLSAASETEVAVQYTTADGNASAASDYLAASGTITFTAGVTEATITVPISGDLTYEANETLSVTLSNATGATITTASASGTITNDDAAPALVMSDRSATEGTSGASTLDFVIALDAASGTTTTVSYATQNGTATAGVDYTAASGTLTFTPGQTAKTIDLIILGDTSYEVNETFSVVLSNASGATIGTSATVTILNDDSVPSLSIGNSSVLEGDSGTSSLVFTATLNAASGVTATIFYDTDGGSATPGSDYTYTSGTLSFAPGETAKPITVPVSGDTTFETNETVLLLFAAQSGVTLNGDEATGTIVNDDGEPSLSMEGGYVWEGDSGTTSLPFTVTLSAESAVETTVQYSTSGGDATQGSDYTPISGTLTFTAGVTQQVVLVPVIGDLIYEFNESVHVSLSNPSGASLATFATAGTIIGDDTEPNLTISDASVIEGNSGTTSVAVTVTLSHPSAFETTVQYETQPSDATAGTDYVAQSGTLTFTAGVTQQVLLITVNGDTAFELDEAFSVLLANASGANIASGAATITIVNDDDAPDLTIAGSTTPEGNSGTSGVLFLVTLSPASDLTTTVSYATQDGSASAGSDYTAQSGTLTFLPGETSKAIVIAASGDTLYETNETFSVTLSAANGADITTASALGTITNDDSVPSLSIASALVSEGHSGTRLLNFTIVLNQSSGLTTTVQYQTMGGSATAGSDYQATSGTATIPPGETETSVSVVISGDITYEPNETLTVLLSNPTGATIATAVATGTIFNDDGQPSLTVVGGSAEEGNSVPFTVTLSAASGVTATVQYSTTAGTATPGVDYTAQSGTLTFAPGVTQQVVLVATTENTLHEPDETLGLLLSAPTSASIATGTATGTIVNDDGAPTFSVVGGSVIEGHHGTATLLFTVTLSAASDLPASVSYATQGGSAVAGSDYTAASGTLSFAPGETVKTFTVTVNGDYNSERSETVGIALSNPVGASIGSTNVPGTIRSDDAGQVYQPFLVVGPASP